MAQTMQEEAIGNYDESKLGRCVTDRWESG